MQNLRRTCGMLAMLAVLTGASPAGAEAYTWNGSVNDDWFEGANWTPAGPPPAGAEAVYDGAGTPLLLTNETPVLSSFTLQDGTLTCSNWTTRIQATDVVVNGGTITLPGPFTEAQMSNRVWIVCENDFTLGSNGLIKADGKGFAGDNGPGKGLYMSARSPGAGYGGQGGMSMDHRSKGGQPYGVPGTPLAPGSGGGDLASGAGAGGGAVRITANGTATIDGIVTADGNPSSWRRPGGGSGGAIYITCGTFGGTTNGLLSVNGGKCNGGEGGNGGGGRIAVNYQALAPAHGVRFAASPGNNGWAVGTPGSHWHRVGVMGTLWLPDTDMLSGTLTNGQFTDVRLHVGDANAWSVGSLVVENTTLSFAGSNFQVNVSGNVEIGAGGELGIGDRHGEFGAALTCGGDLTLEDGALLQVYACATNGSVACGASIDVAAHATVDCDSWVFTHSQPVNGGSVRFRCGSLAIATNAGFSAYGRGFGDQMTAWGPGVGTSASRPAGGGYGGRGADYSTAGGGGTYGTTNGPLLAGSSGGKGEGRPGRGGGLVWIEAAGSVELDGTITADGSPGSFRDGGGSGGGVFLVTSGLLSAGPQSALLARGGNQGSESGAGGGGRIAVWYGISAEEREQILGGSDLGQIVTNTFAGIGTLSATNGITTSGGAEPGTVVVVFLTPPPSGTIFMIR